MICKTTTLSYRREQKQFLFQNLFLMILGAIAGTLLCRFRYQINDAPMLSLQEVSLFISQRNIRSLILTDVLFSVLILIVSLLDQRRFFYWTLFFLKGFCISYFVFLFLCFYRFGGFLLAVCVLLLHSVLLLPLQLLTAFTLYSVPAKQGRRKPFLSLLFLNVCASVSCAFLEYSAFPLLFSAI